MALALRARKGRRSMHGTSRSLFLLAAWGTTGAGGEDINGDMIVDVADLLLLLAAWGECP